MVKFKGIFLTAQRVRAPVLFKGQGCACWTHPDPGQLVTKLMELIRGLVPRSCGYLPGGGKGGGRKPSGFGALHWLHSVLQAKFWFPQPLRDKITSQRKPPTKQATPEQKPPQTGVRVQLHSEDLTTENGFAAAASGSTAQDQGLIRPSVWTSTCRWTRVQ